MQNLKIHIERIQRIQRIQRIKYIKYMYQNNYQSYLISGNDATEFLQGQFSCDITVINKQENIGKAGAYCLPDGKVLAFFYLCKIAEGYLLVTNDSDAQTFLKRLKMFVLRADVNIEKQDYSIYGMDVEQAQSKADIFIPLNNNLSLLVHSNNTAHPISDNLHSVEHWNYLETLNGVPALNNQLRGQFILPFINLDYLDAVSYQKGCYVGQEIIARLYYRSKPSKRSYVYSYNGAVLDLPLNEIINCVDEQEKPCRITPIRVASWQNKTAIIVEMATRNAPREQLIIKHNEQTYHLHCEKQPYSIDKIEQ